MSKNPQLLIDFRHLQRWQTPVCLTLDKTFFTSLDQDDILGGEASVILNLKELSDDDYQLRLEINSEVEVCCDRCLELTRLAVNVDEEVYFTFNPNNVNQEAEIVSEKQPVYDLTWLIFELIETALPSQRLHLAGECAEDMLERISGTADEDSENTYNNETI